MHPSMSLSGPLKNRNVKWDYVYFAVLFSLHFATLHILCWFPFSGLNVGNFVLL